RRRCIAGTQRQIRLTAHFQLSHLFQDGQHSADPGADPGADPACTPTESASSSPGAYQLRRCTAAWSRDIAKSCLAWYRHCLIEYSTPPGKGKARIYRATRNDLR